MDEWLSIHKNLVVVGVNGGVAEFETLPPGFTYETMVIDYDVLEGGLCPICNSMLDLSEVNGKINHATCELCGVDWSNQF